MKRIVITVNGKDYEVLSFTNDPRVYISRASGNRVALKSSGATYKTVLEAAKASGF